MTKSLELTRLELEEKLRTLLILSSSGDTEAYEGFLVMTSAIVKKYLGHLEGKYDGTDTIEDLLQEVLISIHYKKHTYQLDQPILPWLYAIARYRYIDFYRAKKRAPKKFEFTNEFNFSNEDEGPLLNMEEIISFLSLIKVEGVGYRNAAETLSTSVPALKVSILRIVKSLKERISK